MISKSKRNEVRVIFAGLFLLSIFLILLAYLSGANIPFIKEEYTTYGPILALYHQDFEDCPLTDEYSVGRMQKDFSINRIKPEKYTVGLGEYLGDSEWKKALLKGLYNVGVVEEENGGRCLRITHRAGKYGIVGANEGNGSGAQWTARIPGGYEELYLSYRIRRNPGAEALKEAKLPCLMGSFTWHDNKGFRANSIMNRKEKFGHSWLVTLPNREQFNEPWINPENDSLWSYQWEDSSWYNLCFRVCVNSWNHGTGEPNSDGIIEAFIDGKLISQKTGLRLMEKDFEINQLVMQFFIGGNTIDYAPSSDQHLYIDDICLFVYADGVAPGIRVASPKDRILTACPTLKIPGK